MDNMKKIGSPFTLSKWRSKTFLIAVLALTVGAAVLVSLLAQIFEDHYALRKDFSFNQITTLSEATEELLATLDQPVRVSIIANQGEEDLRLTDLLTRYHTNSPHITWQVVIPSQNPAFIKGYEEKGEELQLLSTVVEAPQTGRYKIINPNEFFISQYNEQLERESRFQYEKTLSEAILYTTTSYLPTALFTTGHNELSGQQVSQLKSTLTSNSFLLGDTNLNDNAALTDTDILFILSPTKDFSPAQVSKLLTYLQSGGSIFVTLDPTTEDVFSAMPNFMALLNAYGIVPTKGTILADSTAPNTYLLNIYNLLPQLVDNPLIDPLTANNNTYLLLPYTLGFIEPQVVDTALQVENLLLSEPSTYEKQLNADNLNDLSKKATDAQGPFALALLSSRLEKTGQTGQIFAMGTSEAFTDGDLMRYTDNEAFLHLILSELAPDYELSIPISNKAYYRPPLSHNAGPMGIALVIVLPILVFLGAVLILLPRKHL